MAPLIQLGRHARPPAHPDSAAEGFRPAETPLGVYVSALGCRVNEAELSQWARALRHRGHRMLASPDQADVVLLNTCAVTVGAARKSRQQARRLRRLNPHAKLVVTGCYAALEPEAIEALQIVDRVVPNRDKEDILAVLDDFDWSEHVANSSADEQQGPDHFEQGWGRTRAFIKVQDGCRHRCSYCIVTVARGEERSRSIDDIVQQIQLLYANGYREAILSGIHLGGYGSDIGCDLYALLSSILERCAMPRIRISSLEPWELPPNFFSLWQSPRLLPHLHLPLQAGCDSTLRRMARRCTTASFAHLVERAREQIPDLSISTDLIVGFPNESDEEFRQTLAFVEQMRFADMHLFTFSARAGTAAARMKGQVHGDVQRKRMQTVREIAERWRQHHRLRFVGQQRSVLWQPTKVPGRYLGYTDNYLPVITDSDGDLDGQVHETHLLELRPDGFRGRISAA